MDIIYTDRSRIEAYWDCPRKRWWNYEYLAPGARHRGIVRNEDATALTFGSVMHVALSSSILNLQPPNEIAAVLVAQLEKLNYLPPAKYQELLNLGQGLYWGFHYSVLPKLLEQYDVIAVEGEIEFSLSANIKQMCRPDLVLQRLSDGTVWYPDFKTTGFKTKQWMDSWQHAMQLQTGCAAIEESRSDLRVEGAMIIGLYKGYKDKNGLLRSPFTYAYNYNGSPGDLEAWNLEWCRGWNLQSVDTYGSMQSWVEHWYQKNPEIISEQFPLVEEIAYDREFTTTVLKKQLRTQEYNVFASKEIPELFPQHTKSCHPVIGSPCAYIDCCFNPTVEADPVGSRLYVVREPHHSQESQQNEERNDER